jgi:hypothetical protein
LGFWPFHGVDYLLYTSFQRLTGAGVRDDFQVFYQATWATF